MLCAGSAHPRVNGTSGHDGGSGLKYALNSANFVVVGACEHVRIREKTFLETSQWR